MNGVHITWELIRNVKFQPIPELPNQNLHFNKILRGNCMYILVWGALVCDTSSLLKRTSLVLEPYPFLCEKHNAWHTMGAQKMSSEWVNQWPIYFTSWWGKRTQCGLLASTQLLVDRVGPGVTEEGHILYSITRQTFKLIATWFASGVPEILVVSTVH